MNPYTKKNIAIVLAIFSFVGCLVGIVITAIVSHGESLTGGFISFAAFILLFSLSTFLFRSAVKEIDAINAEKEKKEKEKKENLMRLSQQQAENNLKSIDFESLNFSKKFKNKFGFSFIEFRNTASKAETIILKELGNQYFYLFKKVKIGEEDYMFIIRNDCILCKMFDQNFIWDDKNVRDYSYLYCDLDTKGALPSFDTIYLKPYSHLQYIEFVSDVNSITTYINTDYVFGKPTAKEYTTSTYDDSYLRFFFSDLPQLAYMSKTTDLYKIKSPLIRTIFYEKGR